MPDGDSRMRRLLILAVLILVGAELLARYVGLGHPPLTVTDPKIEYRFRPNQEIQRFGNRIHFNQFGMRSEDIGSKPSGQFRVIVLGDSVINGGAPTDQGNLATSILSTNGSLYLNVSAGSWGPKNLLEYVTEFGFFDSSVMVMVLSSHDAYDEPTFTALDPISYPTAEPYSALWEGVTRYILPRFFPSDEVPSTNHSSTLPMKALHELTLLARSKGIDACLVLHLERSELPPGAPRDGHNIILEAARKLDLRVIDASRYISSIGYRDNIHLNDVGQAQLAFAIRDCSLNIH